MNETFLGLDPSLIVSGVLPNVKVRSGAVTEADVEALKSAPYGAKYSDADLFGPIFTAFNKVQSYKDGLQVQANALADYVKTKLGSAACFPADGHELMVAVMAETCPLVILT